MEQDGHSKRLTVLASILAKLSSGAELKVETGRWSEERECRHRPLGEVENEEHFILRYEGDAEEGSLWWSN